MTTSVEFHGVIPPVLTPLTGDGARVDLDALRAHVNWLIEKGVHGLMPCGTTGEGLLLTADERRLVLELVVETVDRRVPLLAHVGAITTQETIALACHAQALGVEAVSVVAPYYYNLREAALIGHFCRVADAVPATPVFLYNIPQCTGNVVTRFVAETVCDRCPNVIGIKDSSGNLALLRSFVGLRAGGFQVVCGSDGIVLAALEDGAIGCVAGHANVFPEILVDLYDAFRAGDLQQARRQQDLLDQVRRILEDGTNFSLFKHILERRGLAQGSVRPPLPEASPAVVAKAEAQLRALRLLA